MLPLDPTANTLFDKDSQSYRHDEISTLHAPPYQVNDNNRHEFVPLANITTLLWLTCFLSQIWVKLPCGLDACRCWREHMLRCLDVISLCLSHSLYVGTSACGCGALSSATRTDHTHTERESTLRKKIRFYVWINISS